MHCHLRAVQAYTVVSDTTDMQSCNQLLLRASSVSEKHGHLRAVQAYTVVCDTADICNQVTSYSYERAA